ncbi:MAG TPA: hypothetical protein PKL46_09260, partial [Aquabacterium sp.]|nr:hypothetical protein [Aquabacterium sp.]
SHQPPQNFPSEINDIGPSGPLLFVARVTEAGHVASDLWSLSLGRCRWRDRHAVTPERSAHDLAVQAELDADGLAADLDAGAFPAQTFLRCCADVESIEAGGMRHGKRGRLDEVPWRPVRVPPST